MCTIGNRYQPAAVWPLLLLCMLGLCSSCGREQGSAKNSQPLQPNSVSSQNTGAGTESSKSGAPAPDPRRAFDTGGALSAAIAPPERGFELLSAHSGRVPAASALGSSCLYSLWENGKNSLCLVSITDGGTAAFHETTLPAAVLSLLPAGEKGDGAIAFLADGSLVCFDSSLKELWKKPLDMAGTACSFVSLPLNRFAAAGGTASAGRIRIVNAENGETVSDLALASAPRGIAYAAGFVLSLEGKNIIIYDENDLREAGRCELDSPGRFIAASADMAGIERAAVMEDSGRIETLTLPGCTRLSLSASSFDRTLPPVFDGKIVFAAAAPKAGQPSAVVEIDAETGAAGYTYNYQSGQTAQPGLGLEDGPLSSFWVDSGAVYALCGARLGIAPRNGSAAASPAAVFVLPAVPAECAVGADRSLVFVSRNGSFYRARSASTAENINTGLAPSNEVSEAIFAMLDKYRAREPGDEYINYDVFVDGLAVDPGQAAFAACSFKADQNGRGRFSIARAADGARILLAVFSEQGALVDSNFDDYGLSPVFILPLEKGRNYWLVTGRLDDLKEKYHVNFEWAN